jgi:hypothetical protein
MRRALESLIAEEENRIRVLKESLEEYTQALDRRVVRALVYRGIFGPKQTETLTAQTDTEEASKPVTETTELLARSVLILQTYRQGLAAIESGATLEDLARLDPGGRADGDDSIKMDWDDTDDHVR